jgi:MarR family transcriptional regulator, organic hydroperoxide resistance regulator
MDIKYTEDHDFNLSRLLFQTRHAMSKARDRELAKYGITAEQAAVLFCVKANDNPPTLAEISRWLIRESHTISNLVKRMEQAGLVKKTADLEKKNQIRVSLTEKGELAFEKSIIRNHYHRVVAVLSRKERRELWTSLMKLRDEALKEIGIDKPPFPTSL